MSKTVAGRGDGCTVTRYGPWTTKSGRVSVRLFCEIQGKYMKFYALYSCFENRQRNLDHYHKIKYCYYQKYIKVILILFWRQCYHILGGYLFITPDNFQIYRKECGNCCAVVCCQNEDVFIYLCILYKQYAPLGNLSFLVTFCSGVDCK